MHLKILQIDDFEAGRKARYGPENRRVQFGHLCIYKISGAQSVTYYRRYLDQSIAHDSEAQIEKWLQIHMKDKENLLIDQIDLGLPRRLK